MEQEKRALLAVALCLLVLLTWPFIMGAWQRKVAPPASGTAGSPSVESTISPTNSAPPAAAAPAAAAPAAAAAPGAPAAPAAPPVPAEQRLVVEQAGWYRAELTNYGAALSSFEMLNPKYFTRDMRRLTLREGFAAPVVDRRQTDGPTNLVAGYRPSLTTRFTSGFELPKVPAFTLAANETWPDGGRKVVYVLETPDYRLEKSFVFPARSFQMQIQVSVQNKRSTPANYHLEMGLEGFQDPAQKPGGTFSARVPQNEVSWDRSRKYYKYDLDAVRNGKPDADDQRGDVRWVGIGQQYFMFALALPRTDKNGDKQARTHAEENGELSITAELAEHTLQPNETRTYHMVAYGGPKLPELLDEVTLDGQTAGLSTSIDYTLESLARPMLWVMRKMHALTHNWAIAIILLTLLVKLLLLYPSHRSMVSMKAMGSLKPQIDALRDKCGDDKQKFNMEMMALYKKHNINPVGGCLPILLQMPIYFALYSMLGNAVELYRVRLFWIPDLTTADPYFVLPVVTGALMYFQSKVLSPAVVDPQQKTMATMMPVMFTVFTIFVPAGLTLYIMTNTILGMIQQAVINGGNKGTSTIQPPPSLAAAAGKSAGGDKPAKGGDKASKSWKPEL